MKRYYYHYELAGVFLSLIASYIGGKLTRPAIESGYYDTLIKSSLNPPEMTFPIVWTILFILMGIGIGRIWRNADSFVHTPIETGLFFIQLGMNILWSYLFFTLKQPILSFLEIVPFFFLIAFIALHYYKIDKIAGLCYLPYALWVGCASYLNYFIVVNN
jgi:tryptophan-rich sensory protein